MQPDYFSNHGRASTFPWSIYHRPLERLLQKFLMEVSRSAPYPRVLVIGGGYMHELPAIPPNVRLTVVDVDDRIGKFLSQIRDPRLERCLTIADAQDLERLGEFDAIYGKEVIEHILDVGEYMAALVRHLVAGGRIWVSTPNYGDHLLPFLEATVLELIGRFSGYSRKELHPTRFSAEKIKALFEWLGLEDLRVIKTTYRLALVAVGTRRCA